MSGIDDVMVRFGRCCNPLPGERITGFITRGRGVTVHAIDCLRVMESDPQRRVEVGWDGAAGHFRPVQVEVTGVDAPGLLAAMSKAISSAGVNISRAEVRTGIDKKAVNVFELMVDSVDALNRVMRGLGKVKGVMKVQSGAGMSTTGKRAIATTAAPQAIGPYSQAVAVGDLIFLSGQIPSTPTAAA